MSGINTFVILLLALALSNANANIEGDALSSWKKALEDPLNVLKSWDPTLNDNPCSWLHVICTSEGSVVSLDIGTAGLSGPIVPELGMLANLLWLRAFGNNLTGTIPVELGNLTNLVILDLSNNTLSGPIPSALGNLSRLKFLRLNNNMLSGILPDSIFQLIKNGQLQTLDVSRNQLAGTFPANNQTGFAVTTIIQDPRDSNA